MAFSIIIPSYRPIISTLKKIYPEYYSRKGFIRTNLETKATFLNEEKVTFLNDEKPMGHVEFLHKILGFELTDTLEEFRNNGDLQECGERQQTQLRVVRLDDGESIKSPADINILFCKSAKIP